MDIKKYKIIFLVIIAIFALVFLNSYKSTFLSVNNTRNINAFSEQKKENISVTLIIGEKKIFLKPSANSSLYDAMLSVKQNNQINFSGKKYPGLGFFVESVDTLKNKDGKYLFYYVNGKEASVGVSSYLLKDGDVIEWKLK